MKSFQILDKENTPISIHQLDKEAAEFWGVEFDSKEYAQPVIEGLESFYIQNWFDVIGFQIANQGNYTSGWNNVVTTILSNMMEGTFVDCKNKEEVIISSPEYVMERYAKAVAFVTPYINLIKHWQSKGYQPKQVE